MIHLTSKSIFESPARVLVNPVNVVGVMGRGLALTFKQRFPEMFVGYKEACRNRSLRIGQPWLHKSAFDKWVLCFPTKGHFRHPSQLDWIEEGLQTFSANYERLGIRALGDSIAFPRLGCGNGGLEWREVKMVMEKYLSPLPMDVYLHT